ncbi:hypothetical protein [Leucobacter ruminantium]|uniref:hypothetical protein n=1 Tax=Leucobacter ruminantium TaxID=1289170 RepID=UPI001FB60154|nr:hypothetical protein [Leucobacter ruminantium]
MLELHEQRAQRALIGAGRETGHADVARDDGRDRARLDEAGLAAVAVDRPAGDAGGRPQQGEQIEHEIAGDAQEVHARDPARS